jgi:putative transposase
LRQLLTPQIPYFYELFLPYRDAICVSVVYRSTHRALPHIFPDNTPIFFTWRLYGSLPAAVLSALKHSKDSPGTKFRTADKILDRADAGPHWLRDPRVAKMVSVELESGAREYHRYELMEYVVMSNHVHVLIFPHNEPASLMQMLKGITARRANAILGRKGLPFWQFESFDHWCRSTTEVLKIRKYIEDNPVKCGLVAKGQDWPWSSAHRRLQQKRARLVQRTEVGR